METLIKANIFFFISSISVIIFTIIFLIASIYLLKILNNFYKISKILRKSSEKIDDNLKNLSEEIRNSILFRIFFKRKNNKEE